MSRKMFGSGGSDYLEGSETGNWNVAGQYVVLKIMRWLYLADEYETVATFGSSEMMEEFIVDQNSKNLARLKAINRLNKTLIMIINNTLFAIKHKNDRIRMLELKQDLLKLEKVLKYCEIKTFNFRDKKDEIRIDEEKFSHFLNLLVEIKAELNEPLNKSELIFMNIEEWDAEAMKQRYMKDLIEGG